MLKKATLASAILIALTACSSGSDHSNTTSNTAISPTNSGTNTAPVIASTSDTNPTTDTTPTIGSITGTTLSADNPLYVEGSKATDPVYGGSLASTYSALSTAELSGSADTLVIDGQTISLNAIDIAQKGSGTYNNYGWFINPDYKDSDADNANFIYSIGQVTPVDNIPTSGRFTYMGKGFHGSEALGKFLPSATYVNVDFAEKTVNIDFVTQQHYSNDQKENFYLSGYGNELPRATISGNTFSGSANNTHLNGKFYGNNAEELGATYYNDIQGFVGVFSAEKQ